jgi:chaperone BCS1
VGDVQIYLDSKKIYTDLGIPYRRGYLLAGPPGTGKSTLILAVASHFKLPIYSVPLRGTEMTGERLSRLLSNCRKPSLIALEDVDCLKVATSRKSKSSEGLTMADLLNVIDGIGASEDRVLFMTANHPETLDAALTRAGRVDRKFYIDYARDEELQSFHSRVAQYYSVQAWPEFRAALPERATIADAQALAFQKREQ